MNKPKKRRRIFLFRLHQARAVEEYLEKMAAKGWMLENLKGGLWVQWFSFTKTEPKKIKFAVDIFERFNSDDSKNEYIEYCEEAGWNFICEAEKILIFYSEEPNPIPIHTDPVLKLEIIHKSEIFFFRSLLLPIIFIFFFFIYVINFRFCNFITGYLVIGFAGILLLIMNLLVRFVDYRIWYLSSKKKVQQGDDIKYRNIHQIRIVNWLFFLSGGALFICLPFFFHIFPVLMNIPEGGFKQIGYILLICGLPAIFIIIIIIFLSRYKDDNPKISKHLMISAAIAAMMLIFGFAGIFAFQHIRFDIFSKYTYKQLPIAIEDLGFSNPPGSYRNATNNNFKSIFAKKQTYEDSYYESGHMIGIEYSVIESQFSWVISKCIKSLVSDKKSNYSEIDSSGWGAKKVYRDNGHIIAVYGNKILQFEGDIKYTPEQISMIRKKLNLY